jgi:hypothetical protein
MFRHKTFKHRDAVPSTYKEYKRTLASPDDNKGGDSQDEDEGDDHVGAPYSTDPASEDFSDASPPEPELLYFF